MKEVFFKARFYAMWLVLVFVILCWNPYFSISLNAVKAAEHLESQGQKQKRVKNSQIDLPDLSAKDPLSQPLVIDDGPEGVLLKSHITAEFLGTFKPEIDIFQKSCKVDNACFTSDAASNESGISNSPSATTTSSPTEEVDTEAPAAVTDLVAGSPTNATITLTWTAPSDNISVTAYDIRYRTGGAVTEANWGSATQVSNSLTPKSPGQTESLTVTNLDPETTYYFALKSTDAASNESAISNSPSGTTTVRYE